VDRLVLDRYSGVRLAAANTDLQAVRASLASERIQLGRELMRGMGAAGDIELGQQSVAEAEVAVRGWVAGADLVVLCAGLGGGTGSGAAPSVAAWAREAGASVVAVVTLPFGFEGRKRRAQAEAALEQLRAAADLAVVFDNDRMHDLGDASGGAQAAFAQVDRLLGQCVRGVCDMARRRGLLHAGRAELARMFGGRGAQAVFGWGEAAGDNRAHDAVARAWKGPLAGGPKPFAGVTALMASVVGGPSMTLAEVEVAMGQVQRLAGGAAEVYVGVAVDPELGEKLSVTLLGAITAEAPAAARGRAETPRAERVPPRRAAPEREIVAPPAGAVEPPPVAPEVPEAPAAGRGRSKGRRAVPSEVEPDLFSAGFGSAAPVEPPEPAEDPVAPEAEVLPVEAPAEVEPENDATSGADEAADVTGPEDEPASHPPAITQPSLPLERVSRGRFENSEPTIVDGQDLDVPTFLRKNFRKR
jgi:cell division protein FtsZ